MRQAAFWRRQVFPRRRFAQIGGLGFRFGRGRRRFRTARRGWRWRRAGALTLAAALAQQLGQHPTRASAVLAGGRRGGCGRAGRACGRRSGGGLCCRRAAGRGAGRRGRRRNRGRRAGGQIGRVKRQHAQQRHIKAGVFVRGQRQIAAAGDGDLVIQLHIAGRQHAGQGQNGVALGLVGGQRRRHGLRQGDLVQQLGHFVQRGIKTDAACSQLLGLGHQRRAVAVGQRRQQGEQITAVHRAQHGAHAFFAHFANAVGNGLIQQRQRIAHRARRRAAQQGERGRLVADLFGIQHMRQMRRHLLRGHIAQRELQTARQHGDRHFLRVGGGQDEFDVGGRFFQRFQHGVERRLGQHVHFIDDVHLEAAHAGRVLGVVQHFADIVDAGVAGGVDFQQVHKPAGVNLPAGGAHAARLGAHAGFAVQAFGQNAGNGGFAHAARAGQQVGVMQALFDQRIGQGAHHMLLADQIGKTLGAPLAGKNLIGHGRGFYPICRPAGSWRAQPAGAAGRHEGLA